jgi:predicted anti-sigma-YlaC factor YlaD
MRSGDGCEGARAWLSARRDGEAGVDPVHAAHVEGCTGCRRWGTTVDDLTRRMAVRPAGTPDVVGAALAAAATAAARRRAAVRWARPRQAVLGRALLGACAAAVLGVAAAQVLPVLLQGAGAIAHVRADVVALESAVGIGLLLAAGRPGRYAGPLLPMVAAAAVMTTLLAATAVTTGAAHVREELAHLPLLVGLFGLLLVADARQPARAPAG